MIGSGQEVATKPPRTKQKYHQPRNRRELVASGHLRPSATLWTDLVPRVRSGPHACPPETVLGDPEVVVGVGVSLGVPVTRAVWGAGSRCSPRPAAPCHSVSSRRGTARPPHPWAAHWRIPPTTDGKCWLDPLLRNLQVWRVHSGARASADSGCHRGSWNQSLSESKGWLSSPLTLLGTVNSQRANPCSVRRNVVATSTGSGAVTELQSTTALRTRARSTARLS